MKILISIIAAILTFLVFYTMGWSIWNATRCTKMDIPPDATCEQVAENNTKNCKYLIQWWGKVDYDKELQNCKKLKK